MATRLDRVGHDGVAAVVVAAAALDRLGWGDRIAERLDVATMLPQVGQGALAVECRADDGDARCALGRIEHLPARRTIDAERGFLSELGGDCSLPAAAHATLAGDSMRVRGLLATADGVTVLRHELSGPAAAGAALGRSVARHLLDEQGGAQLLGRG
jgi:hydroxymethylbilane synthase